MNLLDFNKKFNIFRFIGIFYVIIAFILLILNPILIATLAIIFNIIMLLCSTTILFVKKKFSIHDFNVVLMYLTFGIYLLLYFMFYNKILDQFLIHIFSVICLGITIETYTLRTLIRK